MFFDFDSDTEVATSEVATPEVSETDCLENLTLTEKIEYAEFALACAQTHLDELLAERAEIEDTEAWNEWADANAPEDIVLDNPSDWEVQNGI